ncbi:MAG TPA: PAS domain-containing protein [Thermodesulfobacteriota bacterium]|nr:PAS domain-containing protein [Thermodesulfobacteriota bacterium]
MNGENGTRGKLKALDKIISELVIIREQIADSIASNMNSQTAADALRESERDLREVIENLPQRVFLKDKNLVYRFCNERYARDLRMKPENIVGKSDFDLYPKELAAKFIADEQRILSTGKAEEIEERYMIPGEELTILATKVPIKDETGNVRGILATFWDITERKKAEEEGKRYILRLKELVAERRAQIESLGDQLLKEVAERKRIEEDLQRVRASFEDYSSRNGRKIQAAK